MDSMTSVAPEQPPATYQQRTQGRRTHTIALTDESIRGCLPVAKRSFFWDRTLPGFGIDVNVPDRVAYVVRGTLNGNERRVVLRNAPWPHREFKPQHARAAAKQLLAEWALGRDPYAKPEPVAKVTTLRDAAREYVEYLRIHAKPGSIRAVERAFIGTMEKGSSATRSTASRSCWTRTCYRSAVRRSASSIWRSTTRFERERTRPS
jgi:hypothetical protein